MADAKPEMSETPEPSETPVEDVIVEDEIVEETIIIDEASAPAAPPPPPPAPLTTTAMVEEPVEVVAEVPTEAPAEAPVEALYTAATPPQQVVYVQAPVPPQLASNRGVGATMAVVAAIVYGVLLAGVAWVINYAMNGATDIAFLASWDFYIPVAVFVVALIVVVLAATAAMLVDELIKELPTGEDALSLPQIADMQKLLKTARRGRFTREQLEATAAFVSARGGGLLVLGGRSFEREGLAGTPLEEVLPVDMSDRRGTVARASADVPAASAVQLTGDGAAHPATRIGASAEDARRLWAGLPALASVAIVGGPRAGAQVLATAGATSDTRPLVAVQRYGQGRAMVFAGEASWRWRMMRPAADTTYDTIWRQMSRWLARGALEPVSVVALGNPSPGTVEAVSVLVRDPDFTPVDDAEVQVVVTAPGGDESRVTATLADAADGRYEAPVRFTDAGVYRLAADARRGADRVGAGERIVLAGGADPEMADPRLNEAVLQRLAEQTGGLYVRPDAVAQIAPRLQTAAAVDGPPELRDLWHGAWSLVAVIAVLAAEWTLRRRVGLA